MNRFETNVGSTRTASLKKQEDRSTAVADALSSIRSAKITGNAAIQAKIIEKLRLEEAEAREANSKAQYIANGLSK